MSANPNSKGLPILTNGGQVFEATLLNYREDGTTFWNAVLITPVFAGGEVTYFFASQLDVTDRMRADEHLFLLNRELDHRVKNTLATVRTVVHQTLRDGDVPELITAAATGRIRAIARTHDVLTREAWASALVLDVVQGALDPLHDRFGDRIRVAGPDVRLKSRVATMLSLAMHELGENAVRHGSLSGPHGTVDVGWSIGNGRFNLEWAKRGGAIVVARKRTGYGIRIVERVLAAEFGSTSQVEFDPDGVVFRLSTPSAGLQAERTAWASPISATSPLKDGPSLPDEGDAFSKVSFHPSSSIGRRTGTTGSWRCTSMVRARYCTGPTHPRAGSRRACRSTNSLNEAEVVRKLRQFAGPSLLKSAAPANLRDDRPFTATRTLVRGSC